MKINDVLKDAVDTESEDESEHEIMCANYKSPLDNEIACMSIAMSVADDPEILTRKETLTADTAAATVDSVNDPTGMGQRKATTQQWHCRRLDLLHLLQVP